MKRILVALITAGLVIPALAMAWQDQPKSEKSSQKKTPKKKSNKRKAEQPKAQ